MTRNSALAPTRPWLLLFLTIFTLCDAQQITNGPLAIVSLASEMAYKTGRACAVGCLVYNGRYPCAAGAFWQDIGVWLGCARCAQINACYCSEDLASSATSLIDECVSRQCSGAGVEDWGQEVTKMLNLYDGYCATANVAPTTTSRTPLVATTRTPAAVPTDNPAPGAGSNTDGLAQETRPPTSSSTDTPTTTDDTEKKGLSQSDIVALAASLGVGIPSLLIAAITLCVQLKKRKRNKKLDEARTLVGSIPASVSHLPTPYQSQRSTPVPQGQGFAVPTRPYGYQGQPYGGAPEIGYGDGIPLQQRGFRY